MPFISVVASTRVPLTGQKLTVIRSPAAIAAIALEFGVKLNTTFDVLGVVLVFNTSVCGFALAIESPLPCIYKSQSMPHVAYPVLPEEVTKTLNCNPLVKSGGRKNEYITEAEA